MIFRRSFRVSVPVQLGGPLAVLLVTPPIPVTLRSGTVLHLIQVQRRDRTLRFRAPGHYCPFFALRFAIRSPRFTVATHPANCAARLKSNPFEAFSTDACVAVTACSNAAG